MRAALARLFVLGAGGCGSPAAAPEDGGGPSADASPFSCEPGPNECVVEYDRAFDPYDPEGPPKPTRVLFCERCPTTCRGHIEDSGIVTCFSPEQYCYQKTVGFYRVDIDCVDVCATDNTCEDDWSSGSIRFCCDAGSRCDIYGGCLPPAACRDGVDNDGDGVIDFPYDEGCADADDETECGPGVADDFDQGDLADCQWAVPETKPWTLDDVLLAGGRLWQSAVRRISSAGLWHIEGDLDVRVTTGMYETLDWGGSQDLRLFSPKLGGPAASVYLLGGLPCAYFDTGSTCNPLDAVIGPPPAVLRVTRTGAEWQMFVGIAGEWQEVGVDGGPFIGWDGPAAVEISMGAPGYAPPEAIEPGSAWMDDFEAVTGQVVFAAE